MRVIPRSRVGPSVRYVGRRTCSAWIPAPARDGGREMSTSPTGWRDSSDNGPLYAAGMVMFGATLLGIVGVFEFLQGTSALRTDEVYIHGKDYTYKIDV